MTKNVRKCIKNSQAYKKNKPDIKNSYSEREVSDNDSGFSDRTGAEVSSADT